jgi:hypothetical protein
MQVDTGAEASLMYTSMPLCPQEIYTADPHSILGVAGLEILVASPWVALQSRFPAR